MRNANRRELSPRELQRQRRQEQIQRRRLVAALCFLGLIIVIIVLVATCNSGKDTPTATTKSSGSTSTTLGAATYDAYLTGDSAVPPVDTTATGTLTLTYDPVSTELSFTLSVEGLATPSVATVYQGAEGESGTAVYTLFAGPDAGIMKDGVLAQGTIHEDSLTGPLNGGTLADLIGIIQDGNAYVSVGTPDNPVDDIRGQISLTFDDTSTTDTTDDTSTSDTTDTTG